MNQQMYASASVQANLKTLTKHQTLIIAPESGKQACGDIGEGRLAQPQHPNLASDEQCQALCKRQLSH
jgi:phosphopantothenoylcysteine decarboxylase/phosphopantothenate--cysteine ligase